MSIFSPSFVVSWSADPEIQAGLDTPPQNIGGLRGIWGYVKWHEDFESFELSCLGNDDTCLSRPEFG